MNARIRLRLFSAAAALIMMITIFYMSAQSGDTSASLSGSVTGTILEKTDPAYSQLDETEKAQTAEKVGYIIRKLAHFCKFFILGGVFAVFAFTFEIKAALAALISASAGALYAVSDELHQYFVPGRSCKFTDMLIDCAGVVCACALVWLVIHKIRKNISKKQNSGGEKNHECKAESNSGAEL